jgi:hypothetical protein
LIYNLTVEDRLNIISEKLKFQDNFLDKDLIESLHNKLTDPQCPWTLHFTWQESENTFWHCKLEESDVFKDEVQYLKNFIKQPVIRIYANGQTYTQHGDFHHDDGQETILIGINKEFNAVQGGGTEFLINNNCSYVIYPIYNRAIFFDAQLQHRALPTLNKMFRITLAIKTGYDK